MKVYLVFKTGPEWNNLIKAFGRKDKADQFAKRKNKNKSKTEAIDILSNYHVQEVKVEV